MKMRECRWCKGTGKAFDRVCHNCDGNGGFPEFTDEEKQQFKTACYRTWQSIGSDVQQCCRDCGERLTVAGMVESTLDADYMETYGWDKKDVTPGFILRMRQLRYSGKLAEKLCREAISL